MTREVFVSEPFDNGGWLVPGLATVVNNTDEPERVQPPPEADGGR